MKSVKKICVITLLFIINVLTVAFAEVPKEIIENTATDSIVSLSSQTVNTKTEFYLIINLSKIDYTKFKVEITNNNNLLASEITEEVSRLSSNNVVTDFIVDKTMINLDKLGVVYVSPKKENVINFSIKISNLDETKDEIEEKITALDTTIIGLKESLKSLEDVLGSIEDIESELYKSTQTSIKEATDAIAAKEQEKNNLEEKLENFSEFIQADTSIKVIEEDEKNELWGDKDTMLNKNKEMNASMKKMMEQMSGLESDLKNANNRISSLTQGEVYQGSQNNYLKNLSISGIKFKNEFKKTTADYFARLDDDDLEKVTVNAVAEDNSAIVTIYGNTGLENGKNKIIINVTADNGSVRTYRIYLTR